MKAAKFKARREALRDTNPAGTWHRGLGLPGSRARRKYISVVKPPRPWYFVMATLADQYRDPIRNQSLHKENTILGQESRKWSRDKTPRALCGSLVQSHQNKKYLLNTYYVPAKSLASAGSRAFEAPDLASFYNLCNSLCGTTFRDYSLIKLDIIALCQIQALPVPEATLPSTDCELCFPRTMMNCKQIVWQILFAEKMFSFPVVHFPLFLRIPLLFRDHLLKYVWHFFISAPQGWKDTCTTQMTGQSLFNKR